MTAIFNISQTPTIGLVLAAGMGKRMQSDLPKVAHTILGKPLIVWALEALLKAGIKHIVTIISPQQKIVENIILDFANKNNFILKICYQDKPLGTGHAAQCGLLGIEEILHENSWHASTTDILVAYGDTPAVQNETFISFVNVHKKNNNDVSILGFHALNPHGYGRIIVDKLNQFEKIVEEKDCTPDQKEINLCNSGFLTLKSHVLQTYLPRLSVNNAANEYYLTDIPSHCKKNGGKVAYTICSSEKELAGVNTQEQLAQLARELQNRI